ncbi:MAG: hypothetical protein U5L02_15180 [Rheinheimera sp.]|nr:hypothetical protein [Rheinheimera sp.]
MSHSVQTISAAKVPVGFGRRMAVWLSTCWLVWLLAAGLGAQTSLGVPAQSVLSAVWQSAPDQADSMVLQAQSERSSPQLFLHAKQQPVYVLVTEPVVLLLRLLVLLSPVVLVLAWFIRAGPRRSFRLALWRDANLCCKSQLYH